MTHLSDFSFLQRAVSLTYLQIWYTYRIYTLDRFQCFHPSRFKQGELKSIVSLLIYIMFPFQLYYDATSTKIKYQEGFADIFGNIMTKPEMMWTEADRSLVIPTDYSLCIGFALQTGTLLLLQCFWNYLANSVAKANFMSSKEFMFYILWTFLNIIIFPVLQWNFSREVYSPTYKEIIPELVYGIELLIVSILGIISHFRFRKLLKASRGSNNARAIIHKIRYFQELNLILSVVLFIDAASFIILSADGLTGRKTLNVHKFSADFLICNVNVSSIIIWFIVILIFHPKPSAQSASSSIHAPSQEFLSTGKQFDVYPGSPVLPQISQASTEYMQYSPTTKPGAVVVPMPNNQPGYANGNTFQFGHALEEPVSMQQQQQPPSATALVHPNFMAQHTMKEDDEYYKMTQQQQQQQRGFVSGVGGPLPALSESAVTAVNHNNADWESTIDWPMEQAHHHRPGSGNSTSQEPLVQANHLTATSPSVRRQKSDDSMWLHQSLRGAANARST